MEGHSVPVAPTEDQGSHAAGPGPEGTGIDAEAADLRIELEIEARRRERWIRHRLNEEATLGGALAAGVGREVAVQVATGDRVSGRLVLAGGDVVEIRRRGGATWVSVEAITALEVGEPLPAAGPPADGTSMVEVLCDLVEERSQVVLTLAGGTAVRGELLAVGAVATVDTGPGGRTTYVPVAAIVSVARPA
jgi:hypothetical protein